MCVLHDAEQKRDSNIPEVRDAVPVIASVLFFFFLLFFFLFLLLSSSILFYFFFNLYISQSLFLIPLRLKKKEIFKQESNPSFCFSR